MMQIAVDDVEGLAERGEWNFRPTLWTILATSAKLTRWGSSDQ